MCKVVNLVVKNVCTVTIITINKITFYSFREQKYYIHIEALKWEIFCHFILWFCQSEREFPYLYTHTHIEIFYTHHILTNIHLIPI